MTSKSEPEKSSAPLEDPLPEQDRQKVSSPPSQSITPPRSPIPEAAQDSKTRRREMGAGYSEVLMQDVSPPRSPTISSVASSHTRRRGVPPADAEMVLRDVERAGSKCKSLQHLPSSHLRRLLRSFRSSVKVSAVKDDLGSLKDLLRTVFPVHDDAFLDEVTKIVFESAERNADGHIDVTDLVAAFSDAIQHYLSTSPFGQQLITQFWSTGVGDRQDSIFSEELEYASRSIAPDSELRSFSPHPGEVNEKNEKEPKTDQAGKESKEEKDQEAEEHEGKAQSPKEVQESRPTQIGDQKLADHFMHFPIIQNCRFARHIMRIVRIVGGTAPNLECHVDRIGALKALRQFNEATNAGKLEMLESEERSVMISIHAQYMDAMIKVERSKRLKLAEREVAQHCLYFTDPNSEAACSRLRYTFQKMVYWAKGHVDELWGEGGLGLQVSAFTPSRLAFLFLGLEQLDEYTADDDPRSTIIMTSQKMTFESCPPKLRYYFFTCLAAKSAIHACQSSLHELRRRLMQQYMLKTSNAEPSHQQGQGDSFAPIAISALVQSIEMHPCGSGAFGEKLSAEFYETVKQLEIEKIGPLVCDDSIKIEYQRGEIVGRGNFGVVHRCLNVHNGTFLALKELPMPRQEDRLQSIRGEVNTLKIMRHENIVSFLGAEFDSKMRKVRILMEYAPKSLRSIIDEVGGLAMSLTAHYARKVLLGLAYLHERGVIHRDIKAANILVTDNGEIKVSDFGIAMINAPGDSTISNDQGMGSKRVSNDSSDSHEQLEFFRQESELMELRRPAKQIVGTPLFMAPELLHGVVATEASDIWAFGCLLIEMASGEYPWAELTRGERIPPVVLLHLLSNATEPPKLPEHIKIPHEFQTLLSSCLAIDPAMRPTAKQLLEHEFFRGEWKKNWAETAHGRAEVRGQSTRAGGTTWMSDFDLSDGSLQLPASPLLPVTLETEGFSTPSTS